MKKQQFPLRGKNPSQEGIKTFDTVLSQFIPPSIIFLFIFNRAAAGMTAMPRMLRGSLLLSGKIIYYIRKLIENTSQHSLR